MTGSAVAASILGNALPPIDRAMLAGDYADELAIGLRRGLAAGLDGSIDDDLAFVQPWGFDFEKICRPVRIWQGELDRLVAVSHGRWLAEA